MFSIQNIIPTGKVAFVGAVVLFLVNFVMRMIAKKVRVKNWQESKTPKGIALRLIGGLLIVLGIAKVSRSLGVSASDVKIPG